MPLMRTCVDQLLIGSHELDGVVAIGDRVALGAMQALSAHRRGIGTDVRRHRDKPAAHQLDPRAMMAGGKAVRPSGHQQQFVSRTILIIQFEYRTGVRRRIMASGNRSDNHIVDASEFGRAVRFARKEQGLSQRALAQRCGCSQRFISELERGKATAELGKALEVLGELGLVLGIERRDASQVGREAVNRLVERVSHDLRLAERRRTSLSDYLEG